jgi:Phosphotransferase enzyme family
METYPAGRIAVENGFSNAFYQLRKNAHKYFDAHEVLSIDPVSLTQGRHSDILKAKVTVKGGSLNICMKRVKIRSDALERRRHLEKRIENEYAAVTMIHESFKQHSQDYNCVKPIACFPADLMIIMEECPGEPFMRLMSTEARFWPTVGTRKALGRYCYLSGKWLKIFQESTIKREARLDVGKLVQYIDVRLQKLVARSAIPFSEKLRSRILNFLEAKIPHMPAADLAIAGVTGDFVPANVLVDRDRMAVLDFGMFNYGSILQDLAQYYQHIDFFRQKPVYSPAVISALQEAFLRGYDPDFDSDKVIFVVFRIRAIVNRLSATMVRKWASLPLHVRLFNRWAFRLQLDELRRLCAS